MKNKILILLILAVLGACSAIGVTSPETFRDRYAYAVTTNASVRSAAVTLLEQKLITPAQGELVLKGTNDARFVLDEALKVSETDMPTAEKKLAAAMQVINNLKQYLKGKGAVL